MVALFAPPDIAVGIRGRARVLKEQMDTWPSDSVITIDVDVVKNDFLPVAPIQTAVTHAVSQELGARLERYVGEVERAKPDSLRT